MLNLLIFGPPGAGKGTQAEAIATRYNLNHISSGEMLRQEAKEGEFKEEVSKFLDAGQLVPDDLLTKMIEEAILESGERGIIFDGYPRTLHQVELLDGFLAKQGRELDAVINLTLDDEAAIARILSRGESSGRSDDKREIVEERFRIYHAQTSPLLKYYRERGRIIDIDGRPDIKSVEEHINRIIDEIIG